MMLKIRSHALAMACLLFPVAVYSAPDTKKLQDRFVAPCCWQESVAVHRSETASEMRAEIDRMIAAGKSEDEIVDAFVARHGERILREPRGNKLVWLTMIPIVLVFAAGLWLLHFIRRQSAAAA